MSPLDGSRGTWFVLPTAFAQDRSLDLESQRRLVDAVVTWGVQGITALGVMGEASALSADERVEVSKTVVKAAAGRVRIAIGCSASGHHLATHLVQQARELGADAAMVSAPPLTRNVDQLPDFFARVAEDGGLPLIVQDDPASTAVVIPTSILLRCLASSGSRTVKLEDPPTPPKITQLLANDAELNVFGGLGGLSALSELRRGACGTMTGFAFPEILAAVRQRVKRGDDPGASAVFDRYLPLIAFEAQPVVGLSIRKEILRRRGVLSSGTTRALTAGVDAATSGELDEVLERVGVLPTSSRFEVY